MRQSHERPSARPAKQIEVLTVAVTEGRRVSLRSPFVMVRIMNVETAARATSISLEGRIFGGVENSATGEVGQSTTFTYHEDGEVIWAEYAGGAVVRGYLVGTRRAEKLHFRYAHLGTNMETSTGVCESIIEVLDDGRVRFHESWAWESRPETGKSIVEELKQ